MTNAPLPTAACVLLAFALSSCGKETDATTGIPHAKTAAIEAKASNPGIDPEQAATLKGFIADSGGQCTDIVGMQGQDLSNRIKVTCSGQAGAAGTVSYTVDLETGQASKDG